MLHKVKIGSYRPALEKSVEIQRRLIEVSCDPNYNGLSLTKTAILSIFTEKPVFAWVSELLEMQAGDNTSKTILDSLQYISNSSHKNSILQWYRESFNFVSHFPPTSSYLIWSENSNIPPAEWGDLRLILEKFYSLLQSKGLPFRQDGVPTSKKKERLNRKKLVDLFKSENNSGLCSLCEGAIKNPRVDHWISVSEFPSLSLFPENLFPICHDCNSDYKTSKPVYEMTSSPFENWFHPFLFPACDELELNYENFRVVLNAKTQIHQSKVDKLDELVKLSERWTDEFQNQKEMYQRDIRRKKKLKKNRNGLNIISVLEEIKEYLEIEQTEEREAFFLVRELILKDITKDQDSINAFIDEINN